jgi:hypothetical protein
MRSIWLVCLSLSLALPALAQPEKPTLSTTAAQVLLEDDPKVDLATPRAQEKLRFIEADLKKLLAAYAQRPESFYESLALDPAAFTVSFAPDLEKALTPLLASGEYHPFDEKIEKALAAYPELLVAMKQLGVKYLRSLFGSYTDVRFDKAHGGGFLADQFSRLKGVARVEVVSAARNYGRDEKTGACTHILRFRLEPRGNGISEDLYDLPDSSHGYVLEVGDTVLGAHCLESYRAYFETNSMIEKIVYIGEGRNGYLKEDFARELRDAHFKDLKTYSDVK